MRPDGGQVGGDAGLVVGGAAGVEAVAALGRPLVVLQEGGYADDALGANVAAWLTGAEARVG